MAKKEETSIPEVNPFEGFDILKEGLPKIKIEEVISTDTTPVATIKEPLKDLKEDLSEEEELIKAEDEHLKTKTPKSTKSDSMEVDEDVEETTEVKSEDKPTEEIEEFSFKPLVKYLSDKQIVDYDEKNFEDNDEGLEKVITSTVEARVNETLKNYKESLPDDIHKLVEFVEAGGDPKKFLELYYGNHSFENFDITIETNQKLIIQEGLRLSGLEDSEILEEIQEIEDLGKLEAKAKLYLPKVQKVEKEQKQYLYDSQQEYSKQQEESRVKYWNSLKDELYTKEDIKGFKLTPKLKDQIWDHMTKPTDKKTGKTKLQINNETRKDAQFLYAYLDMMDFDLTKLEKKAESKVTSELRKKLGNFTDNRAKLKGGKTEIQDQETGFEAFRVIK